MLIDAVDAAWNLFNSPEYLANLAEMIDAQVRAQFLFRAGIQRT